MIRGQLKSNLEILRTLNENDWDSLIIIDGIAGSGKSVLALQICKELDPNFSKKNIAYTPEEFENLTHDLPKYSAILFDEAIDGFFARQTMGRDNVILVKLLNRCRMNNQFFVLCIPSYYDVDKSTVTNRARAVIHVRAQAMNKPPYLKRGFFYFYSPRIAKDMYIYNKKTYKHDLRKAAFRGTYEHYYAIPEKDYRELKALKFEQSRIFKEQDQVESQEQEKDSEWMSDFKKKYENSA